MTLNEIITWAWANKVKLATEFSQLFWVTYTLILPQVCDNGIPEPWNKACIITAVLLTSYGFKNSTVTQGTVTLAKKCFVKDISNLTP